MIGAVTGDAVESAACLQVKLHCYAMRRCLPHSIGSGTIITFLCRNRRLARSAGHVPSHVRRFKPDMKEFPRIQRLPPYVFNITAELKMAARRRGEDIIDMSMGTPDGPTPPHIVAKLVEVAQRQDTHGYSMSKGIPRLRRAICGWYRSRFGVELDPETEAIATIGSKEGIAHLALATLDRGDVVLVPNPSYPIHIYGPVIAGADIRHVRMTPGVDFFDELTRAIREMYPRPKLLIINFPSNPTTQCVELDFFEKVVAVAREYGILVVHDLAYADIVFDGWKAPSIMQVPGAKDVAVEFFTLSKSYNMADRKSVV